MHDRRFLTALVAYGYSISFLRLEKRANGLDASDLPAGVEGVAWIGGCEPYSVALRPLLLKDLERVVHEIQPDLVQAGPLHLSANLVAAVGDGQTGFPPLVSMSWGYDLLYDAPRSAIVQDNIRFSLSRSAAMVGDCATIRRLAISYGMPDERIVTFPWGIDLDHFEDKQHLSSKEHSRSSDTFRLLSTRAWEPIYGVDVIARAFVLAAKRRPELRLVMLGDGSQASLIRQIFQEGDVLDKVQFPGQVGQAELPEYYRKADLYLSASHSDGTSISLLEALACGTPVIVSDIPGNREWIEPGVQGWWYPDGNAVALAQCILEAIDEGEEHLQRQRLHEMGRAARHLAEQRADWKKNFPQLFKAYQIALNVKLHIN